MVNKKIVLISPFPETGNVHAKNTGVGSYSYFLANELSKNMGVEVWAQKGVGLCDYKVSGGENSVNVCRVWNKNLLGIFSILKKVILERPDTIHIQHEINMFGGELSLPFSPFMALIPRLFGVQVITTFHGGMGLKEVDKVFVQENGKKLPPLIIRIAFRYIFALFSLGSNKIIVHEEFQKEQLVEEHFVSKNKVFVVPHGVPEDVEIVDNAKRKLRLEGKKVFLYMGFAAKYKGLLELLDTYKHFIALSENKNTVLVVGAGMAPRLENDEEYKTWYQDLKAKYESLGEFVRFVGFIPSGEIATYYSACDTVLFPYTRRLAASGPMAIAIGYEKNIVLSNVLASNTYGMNEFEFDFNKIQETHTLKQDRIWSKIALRTVDICSLAI